jgi:very-short-patch-repair endonuclease
MSNYWPVQIFFARNLRKEPTREEEILWKELRSRKMLGFKFTRQYPIQIPTFSKKKIFFIADFFCFEKRLVLEVDGLIHRKMVAKDKERDATMQKMGFKILRVTNQMINEDLEKVIAVIREALLS